ncbi:hypothetical protein J5N97_023669 [Dioscorea zingiberensis]|uniref:SAC domain-containing protein n=1 Tax=Dioscorea zingiberensis TaxID=325984 RepID=A0A9D5H879_9LILI|nr:hypothetical protein J5N97_023669 [Dioscorea zingiberensis]
MLLAPPRAPLPLRGSWSFRSLHSSASLIYNPPRLGLRLSTLIGCRRLRVRCSSSSSWEGVDGKEKVESGKKLHTQLRLWEFQDQYVFEPIDDAADSCLAISRHDGSLKLIGELPQCGYSQTPKVRTVFGLIGMLRLLAGSYLFVITQRECVGSFLGHPIFKVSCLQILPCNIYVNCSTEQKKLESEFSILLNAAEKTTGLYFSYDINLTICAQKLHELGNDSKLLPLWRQADPRFLWNNYLLEPLIDSNLGPFLLPVIQGNILNGSFRLSLLQRAGTRMWRRGADLDGYVANFVETEQILLGNGFLASFVQVRGSIPIIWEQVVDLTFKPRFEVIRLDEAPHVIERHFSDLCRKYGSVLAVDLVNQHRSEAQLGEKFANAMQTIVNDRIRYVQFDFHRICGHFHFERLSLLYEQIEENLKRQGYFLSNEKGEKVKEQIGVVRTNCIDCLDRTNVTQSMIGRKMLENQLHQLGLFSAYETISSHPYFDSSFKILWANHGDELSIQYSGTPALKGDIVRYGKRTILGFLRDGWNTLARYYFNNFTDGTKQDAIDLLQGHFIVSANRDLDGPTQARGIKVFTALLLALVLVLGGVMFATLSLIQALNEHEFPGASNDRVVRRLNIVSASDDGNRTLAAPLDIERDLSEGYTPEAVEARSYRRSFSDASDTRVRVSFGGQLVVEDDYGAEGGGALTKCSAGDPVDDDVAGLVDGLVLVEGEVQGF